MTQPAFLDDRLIDALAEAAGRNEAARRLAWAMGCDELMLLTYDDQVQMLLPAPGMPKTFRGGPRWREFLGTCQLPGIHRAEVDLPASSLRSATAVCGDTGVAIVLGGTPHEGAIERLRARMPLLGALLRAEQASRISTAQVAAAHEAAARAHSLAKALDAARASAALANQRLREEHERKDEFLAMLAHELRNPLSPLVNSVEILRRSLGAAGDPALRSLDVMGRQLAQLKRLVDDLLDVSRVSRGAITLRREVLLLASVLQDAADTARPLIDAKKHRLTLAGLETPVYVNGDRARLTQVFANLLQNAAKYTEPGGAIEVGLVRDGSRISVATRDTGVGIPREMLSSVFHLFTQVDASIHRSEGGLGLGLTLARTLVELHGGTILAQSEGRGTGSTFTVTLPAVQPPVPAPQMPVKEMCVSEVEPEVRVLLVEDNPDGAATLSEVLRYMNAQVRLADNGTKALAIAQEFKPAIVLLDIGLPGMDGYEVARRMRATFGAEFSLIALTGYGAAADRSKSKEAGFDEHLVKPVEPAELAKILAAAPKGRLSLQNRHRL